MKERPSKQRVFIVLGMQRSGTSCLAGIIEKAGIDFGKVSQSNLFNLKGNRENIQIMRLHDELFEINGGSWDNPPVDVKWPEHLKKNGIRIIEEYSRYANWGFKDPRTLLALDGWLELLNEVSIAATFRHPLLVAQSLYARDKIPYAKSFSLWKIYNEKLLFYYNQFKFPLISFDLPREEYIAKVGILLRRLNLENDSGACEFYSEDLRHHGKISDVDMDADAFDILRELRRIAL